MANGTPTQGGPGSRSAMGLMIGAIGVVFGDIGTSPLYTVKEVFAGPHPLPVDRLHVFGALSLIFWAIIIVVSIKYVVVVMRADNRGEGGSLALLALAHRAAEGRAGLAALATGLGILAASLFYGDAMITPAISVLSAVEGLQVVAPGLSTYVIPGTIAILLGVFWLQSRGTAAMGRLFGPVMVLWFVTLGILGIRNIGLSPAVLWAVSPHHAVNFIAEEGFTAFLALGSVVLAVTGAEALYADMGHFGKWPIRLGWYLLALPALLLNYFGQGALLLARPEAVESPFYLMAPGWAGIPLLALATAATIIASQAVISGAFSLTRQAVRLGYLPRMSIVHTSESEIGQIYIPFVNWALMVSVLALVVGFGSSTNLASAYGIAVTGDMLITSMLIGIVMLAQWKWSPRKIALCLALFLTLDLSFFLANSAKILHGGWFPLAVGGLIFILLTTWKKGRALLTDRLRKDALPLEEFLDTLSERITRVPGTAIFLTGMSEGAPLSLLHNLKHNKVLHERVVLLTVMVEEVPYVADDKRVEGQALPNGFHRLILRYGFMQDPNIPKALAQAPTHALGWFYEPLSASYFLSRETVIPSPEPGMSAWRETLFAWMNRTSTAAMDFFRLPTNRVVELGSQVQI